MHLMRLPMPLLGVDVDLVVWRGTEGQAPEHFDGRDGGAEGAITVPVTAKRGLGGAYR